MSAPDPKSSALSASLIVLVLLTSSCKKNPVNPPGDSGPAVKNVVVPYSGQLLASVQSPQMHFTARDSSGHPLGNTWIRFRVVDGRNALLITPTDSARTDAAGVASVTYNFITRFGHATLRAQVGRTDSVDVTFRANVIIPGATPQAQFILFGDTYGLVKNINGSPLKVDVSTKFYFTYAVYESTIGLVVLIADDNKNDLPDDTERVIGLIINNAGANGEYKGKTADGLGLGSKYSAIRAIYGPAYTVRIDPEPPAAILLRYLSRGLDVYCRIADTTAFEMHLVPPTGTPVTAHQFEVRNSHPLTSLSSFHQYLK